MRRAVFLIVALLFIAGCKSAPEQAGKEPEKETPAAVEPETQEPGTAAEAGADPDVEPQGEAQVYHIVKKGETLYGIGKMYGVPWEEIVKANKIGDVKALKVGAKLLIPGVTKPPEEK